MKNRLIILLWLAISLGLVGCSNEPPIYESGMSKEEYGEKLGDWLGDKLSSADEAQAENYREKSIELTNHFKKEVFKTSSVEGAIVLVDKFISELLSMTGNQFDLSQQDWEFIASPKVDSSASKRSQLEIKAGINLIITHPLLTSKFGILPPAAASAISKVMKKRADVYYQVLKKSKYSQIIANDKWLQEYEATKFILNTAKEIASSEKLDSSSLSGEAENPRDLGDKIKRLQFKYDFELIDKNDVIPHKYGRSIFELKQLLELTSIDELKLKYDPIKYAKRNLESAYKGLAEKRKYLAEHPDVGWAKTSVTRYEESVKRAEKSLNQANIKFATAYDNDMEKLKSDIQVIKKLEGNVKNQASQYNHNVRIFVKTYQKLLDKGYEQVVIAEALSNGRWLYHAKEYDISKDIQLEGQDRVAFSNYMKTMREKSN